MRSDYFITLFKLCHLTHVDLGKNPKSHMQRGLTSLHLSHPTSPSETKVKGKKKNGGKNKNKIILSLFLFETKMSYASKCTVSNAW